MSKVGCTILSILVVASAVIWSGSANQNDIYIQNLDKPNIELAQGFSCQPSKTCGRMRSCSEAYFYFKQCRGHKKRDGDNDGMPCEKLCGKSHDRMKKLLDAGL
ncbi:MAG: excalibur calcium-binding domain-containing protein [Lentilitoribacter sp.]